MAYDDNDFQSQNLHLAGEGSNKFPPALRSYALPKFDFDDSLHGALRFDSLVETEVFLGIESNEHNQWIEDFSRGHGGIHFNSGEVESCSILRRNNVWSEATSSESVEMMLKSVGQEEIVPLKTDNKESDACDELACMIKPMEPSLNQDNGTPSRMGDLSVPGVQPTLPPVDVLDSVCLLDDVEGLQPQGDATSQFCEGDASVGRGLDDLSVISAEDCLTNAEQSLIKDGTHNDFNQREGDVVMGESLDDRTEKTSPRMQVGSAIDSSHNATAGAHRLNNEDEINAAKGTADPKTDLLETIKGDGSSQEFQRDDQVPDANLLESAAPHLDEISRIDETNVEGTSCVTTEGASGLSDNLGIGDPPRINAREGELIVIGGNNLSKSYEGHDSRVCSMDDRNPVSDIVVSPLPIEDKIASKNSVDGSNNGCAGGTSSLAVASSSAELLSEMHAESHDSSTTLAECTQKCERTIDSEQGDANLSVKESTELCTDNSNMASNGVGAETKLIDSELQSDTAAGNETVSAGGGVIPGAVVDHGDVVLSPTPLVALAHSENCKDTEGMISSKASILDLKTSTPLDSPAFESDKVLARQIVCESADQALFTPDYCKTESHGEAQIALSNKDSQENTKEIRESPAFSDSTANKGDAVRALVKDIDEKESPKLSELTVNNDGIPGSGPSAIGESGRGTIQKHQVENEAVTVCGDTSKQFVVPHVNQGGGSGANQDGPANVSPTVIGTTELSHEESNKEGAKALSEVIDGDANKVSSAPGDPKLNDSSRDGKSFTFDISPLADLSHSEPGKTRKPVSTIQASKVSLALDGSPSTSGLGQLETKVAQELSRESTKVSDGAIARSGSNSTERKSRRSSGKATVKGSSKKGNPVKEMASMRIDRGEKVTNVSLGLPGISQPVQPTEMQRFGHVNSSGIKPFVLAASTSSLPDLNFSASSSAMFQQPFTDLQQVQLRAQIFVYGALIQGTTPDEAYMISAFGGLDGCRSIWENAWRSCIERLHGQKSHLVTPETPLQPRSGARAPEQASKQGALHSNAVSPPISRASGMATPAIMSPVVPLSSPLWSLPTPSADFLQSSGLPRGPLMDYQRALSPLPSRQTLPARSSVAHNSSWISQAPFCGPWAASPQNSALDASSRLSVQLPASETGQLTPVKESSVPHSSGVKHGAALLSGGSSGVFAGISLASDVGKATAASDRPSSVLKPRKRKKTSVPKSSGQNALHPQLHMDVGSASAAGSNLPTSVAMSTPVSFVTRASTEKVISPLSAIAGDLRKRDQNAEGRATLSEEIIAKVKEARVQAEDAATFAAAAVSHSQEMWSQLAKQRKSGLLPDIENKLASAAIAVAAAAAVAKAAAAAASVASNAALQAKLMADEAVISGDQSIPGQSYSISFADGTKNLGKATPASILKGDDGTNNSSSIILAAREAAMRRVEATSAASKQAENMDAIVKAAELAAEAVSQAGKIVAMGDHLSLNEVVSAATECHPNVTQVTSVLFSKSNDVEIENLNVSRAGRGPDISTGQDPSNKKEVGGTNFVRSPPRETPCEDDVRLVDVISSSGMTGAKDARGKKGRKASDLAKTIGVVPEPENGLRSSSFQNEHGKAEETVKGNNIKEGSHVEVFKDGNGFKSAWFSANVLSMKDGKAYVIYDELTTGEGKEKLKEWVALSGEGDVAPKIRTARLPAAVPFEETRKRRRAAMRDYTWSVGDRVDAWIQDSWWEGVITEKNKKDETMFTVHFPARGETSIIRAWHLRSSLIWKDGEWIEWSTSRESSHATHGGDTPQEKRLRLRSPTVEGKGKDKMPNSVDGMEPNKPNEPTLLAIAADEKVFNIGKSTRDESKPDRLRMTRTGLSKEGSRVVFGVPKPGKKRKFMEVSKHYVADRSGKTNEAKDPAKLAKYSMSQVSGTQGWKSTASAESNEKRPISKPRVVKSGKQQNVSGRSISQKENILNAEVSAGTEVANIDHASKTKGSVSHAEDTLEKHNLMEFQSFSISQGGAEGPVLFSSLSLPPDALSSKKLSTSNAKAERVSKGKLAPAGRKLGKIEEGKGFSGNSAKSTSDVVEPRRSNRRIQPTSRLLEGLQSSLMVSKIPSVSHDKTHKSRTGSRANKHD